MLTFSEWMSICLDDVVELIMRTAISIPIFVCLCHKCWTNLNGVVIVCVFKNVRAVATLCGYALAGRI